MSQTPPDLRPFQGRHRRIPLETARDRLLETGRSLIQDTGLTVGMDHLRYEDVIARAGVPRSAAYRAFPTKDLFHAALLCTLTDASWAGSAAFDAETITIALRTVYERRDELHTSEGRRAVFLDTCRRAAMRNIDSLIHSVPWKTYIALNATLLSMPDGELRDQLAESLRLAERSFVTRMAGFYEAMSGVVGRRLRPEYEGDHSRLAALGSAVLEGLGLRNALDPEVTATRYTTTRFDIRAAGADRDPGPVDEHGTALWTLAAIGYTAIVEAVSEEDPDWDPSRLADLEQMAQRMLSGDVSTG